MRVGRGIGCRSDRWYATAGLMLGVRCRRGRGVEPTGHAAPLPPDPRPRVLEAAIFPQIPHTNPLPVLGRGAHARRFFGGSALMTGVMGATDGRIFR